MSKTWADYSEAFAIFAKYGEKSCETFTKFDVLYVSLLAEEASDVDRKRLRDLGWLEDPDYGYFFTFTGKANP